MRGLVFETLPGLQRSWRGVARLHHLISIARGSRSQTTRRVCIHLVSPSLRTKYIYFSLVVNVGVGWLGDRAAWRRGDEKTSHRGRKNQPATAAAVIHGFFFFFTLPVFYGCGFAAERGKHEARFPRGKVLLISRRYVGGVLLGQRAVPSPGPSQPSQPSRAEPSRRCQRQGRLSASQSQGG